MRSKQELLRRSNLVHWKVIHLVKHFIMVNVVVDPVSWETLGTKQGYNLDTLIHIYKQFGLYYGFGRWKKSRL